MERSLLFSAKKQPTFHHEMRPSAWSPTPQPHIIYQVFGDYMVPYWSYFNTFSNSFGTMLFLFIHNMPRWRHNEPDSSGIDWGCADQARCASWSGHGQCVRSMRRLINTMTRTILLFEYGLERVQLGPVLSISCSWFGGDPDVAAWEMKYNAYNYIVSHVVCKNRY